MKVLAADGISPKGIELLQKEFEVVVKDKLPAEELLEIIPQFDAIMVRSASKVTKEVIDRATNLKIIGRAGVGVDNIDIPAATARGIIVINSSGVAKRALAFEMNVLAYDPYINEERAQALGVKVATFDEVIENADFITVHMPLTKETKGMIAMEQMKKMKPGVRLVNCARGGIIDEADLAEALKQGIVAAAAIDVYTSEPPAEKGNPLLEAPNIVLTPHLGASTVEAQIGVSVDVAKGIIAALHGEPVATAVNMAPVSPQVMRVIAPYLTLAERLGGTVVGLADGPIESVEVTYNGEITEVNTGLLTTAVIKGLLNPVMENEVNYVNAPGLAKERGIKVSERKDRASEDFANLITVDVVAGGQKLSVQGTLFGTQGRIVRINDFRVDVDPHARILICPHINRPGVIGTVGTLLGGNGVNISAMQVGTTEEEGKNLMVLTVDNDIPAALF